MTMLDDSRVYARADRVTVRRRKVVLMLVAAAAAVALAAVATGLGVFWLAFVAIVVLSGLYGLLMRLADRRAVEREFRRWESESELDHFELFGHDVPPIRDGSGQFDMTSAPQKAHNVSTSGTSGRVVIDMVRFVACNAAGWALSPLVFALTVLVGKTPSDTTGQRWLASLRDTQDKLEDRSRRTVALAATTASVTAVSTAVVFGGAAAANATPVSTHTSSPVASAAAGASTGTGPTGRVKWVRAPGDVGSRDVGAVLTSATTSSTYTVQAGDTLDSIAAKFSTTYENLAAINHISDPNLIYPGQIIQLVGNPQAAQPTPAAATTPGSLDGLSAQSAGEHSVTSTQTAAQVAVQVALEQVGKPYVWAGAGPSDFDCSGLVMYAWEAAGVSLPHYSVAQFDDTARITEAELEPGDLVFYNNGSGPQPGHVTMYVGNGQVVAADYPGTDVRVEAMDHDGVPMAFGRVQ